VSRWGSSDGYAEADTALQGLSYLNRTGLVWYLPDVPPPQHAGYTSFANFELASPSPVHATIAPLLRTQSGEDLALDLVSLGRLAASLPQGAVPQFPRLSDEFFNSLRTCEKRLLADVDRRSDEEAAKVSAAISASQAKDFTIGFQLGIGSGVAPGVFFDYQGVGLAASLDIPSAAVFSPVLPAFTIPGLPLLFPGTGALGPLTPRLRVPFLGYDANAFPLEREAEISTSGMDISTAVPGVDWPALLAQNSFVGRMWLREEVDVAAPLLTPDEVREVNAAFAEPVFSGDLASLIAAKAREASGATNPNRPDLLLNLHDACDNDSWSSCGVAIKRALDSASDAKQVMDLGIIWGHSFDQGYDTLRKRGRIESSTPESQRVFETVSAECGPLSFAIDKAEESLLKRYVPTLASVLEWANGPIMVALKAFMEPQDVASDFEELKLIDDDIQESMLKTLEPHFQPDWKDRLNLAVEKAVPLLKAP